MGRRRVKGTGKSVASTSNESSTSHDQNDYPDTKEEQLVSSVLFVKKNRTPMKIFATDTLDSSQSDVCEVEWDARSPVTMTQAARHRSQSVNIEELVKNYTEGVESSPTCTSPLMGLLGRSGDLDGNTMGIRYRVQRLHGNGKRRIGPPSNVKGKINGKELLEQLESVLEMRPDEDSPVPLQLLDREPRKSHRIAALTAESSPSGPNERLPSGESPVTSTQNLFAGARSRLDDLRGKFSPILKVKPTTMSPRKKVGSLLDEMWTDEEIFNDDSFIFKATQGEFDAMSTPHTLKRKTPYSSPELNTLNKAGKFTSPVGTCIKSGLLGALDISIGRSDNGNGPKKPLRFLKLRTSRSQLTSPMSVESGSSPKEMPLRQSTPNRCRIPQRTSINTSDALLANLAEPDDMLDSQVAGIQLVDSRVAGIQLVDSQVAEIQLVDSQSYREMASYMEVEEAVEDISISPPKETNLADEIIAAEADFDDGVFPDDGFEDDFMDNGDEISEGQLMALLDMVESQASQEKRPAEAVPKIKPSCATKSGGSDSLLSKPTTVTSGHPKYAKNNNTLQSVHTIDIPTCDMQQINKTTGRQGANFATIANPTPQLSHMPNYLPQPKLLPQNLPLQPTKCQNPTRTHVPQPFKQTLPLRSVRSNLQQPTKPNDALQQPTAIAMPHSKPDSVKQNMDIKQALSSSQKYSKEEIERKKQEALKKRQNRLKQKSK